MSLSFSVVDELSCLYVHKLPMYHKNMCVTINSTAMHPLCSLFSLCYSCVSGHNAKEAQIR